MAVVI